MPTDKQDPFGEYAPEAQTTGETPVRKTSLPDEIESAKYGIGKPRRIIIRGIVAADKSPDDKRE